MRPLLTSAVLSIVLAWCPASAVQTASGRISAAPEMQKLLNAMAGSWTMSLKYARTESRPSGGAGAGHVVFRPGPGGLSLIEEEYSKDSTGEQFGLSVTWWDEAAKGFHALWCDNHLPTGCIVMSKVAHWEGDKFVLGDNFERGGKNYDFREVVLEITPTSYRQELSQGLLGGELKQIVSIQANKEPESSPPETTAAVSKLHMPGPDVQNLMLGVWTIKASYAPSVQMPNGGTGEGTEIWRPGPGGRSVIEEKHEKNANGETDGFSVGWWDEKAGGQRFVWCANDVPQGCVVPQSVAKWEGDRLVFREDTQEHGRKITHAEIFSGITPDSFTQLLQKGQPGEAPKTTVTILAKRKGTSAMQSSAPPAEEGLRAAMMERRRAMLAGDEGTVERLTADDYVQTDISGYVQDKSAWLNEYFRPLAALMKAGKFRWDTYEEKDVQVRMFGNTAVVIGSMSLKGTGAKPSGHTWVESPESTFAGTLRFTRVWVNRDGAWRVAALQNGLIRAADSNNHQP